VDRYPPQSYQPYATAQALRDLGLAETPRIECVDINDRVLRFINAFPQRSELKLEFGLPRGEPDFEVWARNTASKLASVPRNVARAITAQKLNIVTQRLESRYDLIVATNILVYLNDVEALLAIANIESMLAPAGYFIHNELRAAIDQHTGAVDLKPVQARTVRIGPGRKAPLYDAFAIYEKPAIRK
jgi:chemotaxis methyl-accepting protein methylase